jgi:hypothetical protein
MADQEVERTAAPRKSFTGARIGAEDRPAVYAL